MADIIICGQSGGGRIGEILLNCYGLLLSEVRLENKRDCDIVVVSQSLLL